MIYQSWAALVVVNKGTLTPLITLKQAEKDMESMIPFSLIFLLMSFEGDSAFVALQRNLEKFKSVTFLSSLANDEISIFTIQLPSK